MTRRAVCSDRAVVKCAHSASTSAIFDFACSVLFGMLHFSAFLPLPVRRCLWKSVIDAR